MTPCLASLGIPSGTVTFLFSDVVGSTRLWAADPEAMSASLRIHDQIFSDTIAKYDGSRVLHGRRLLRRRLRPGQ